MGVGRVREVFHVRNPQQRPWPHNEREANMPTDKRRSTRKAPPPPGLGVAGRRLWDAVTRQLSDTRKPLDGISKVLLTDACRSADDTERLATQLAGEQVTVPGSTGQPRPNPLFAEVRRSRELTSQLLARLDPRR